MYRKLVIFSFAILCVTQMAFGSIVQPPASQTHTTTDDVNTNKAQDYQNALNLYRGVVRSYNFIWHNPKYSPAQILAVYGTDGEALFTYCTQVQQIVAPLLGDAFKPLEVPKEYIVSFNQDHSVSVALAPVTETPNP